MNARVALSSAAVLLVTACAPAIPQSDQAPQTREDVIAKDIPTAMTPTAAPPKYGGVFVYAPPSRPDTLDPYFSAGTPMNSVGSPLYEALTQLKQPTLAADPRGHGDVEPLLAERWEMPNDKTIIYYLRKGVKFHSGDDFTADDVLFSWEYGRDPKNNFTLRSNFRSVDKIEKVDPYTVRVTLDKIDPDIFVRLNGNPILSKKFVDGGGDLKKTAIGTGPFRMEKFEGGMAVEVRNDTYWEKGKPYLDAVQSVFGLERSAAFAAFTTKKIDFYTVTDKVQYQQFRDSVSDLKYLVFYSDTNYGWYPKITAPPLSDERVRKAIQLVIDRNAINEAIAFGLGKISAPGDAGFLGNDGIGPEELAKTPGWRQPKDEDIAEAKRLMKEAGYPDGFKLRGVYISTYAQVPQIAELTASHLKNTLNIILDLAGLEPPLWTDAVHNKSNFDLAMGNTRVRSDPDNTLSTYWLSTGLFNRGGINDPVLDEMIIKQKSIVDSNARRKVWGQISRRMTEKNYYFPSVDITYFVVMQSWVNNIYSCFCNQPQMRKPAHAWFDVEKMPQERVKYSR
ncbi:MAG: ABC transporter substrate-binding protein [Chloroflexi bacterium]|nr:ABC transporter substrate-binding protein [Chloroflexota bacterium]